MTLEESVSLRVAQYYRHMLNEGEIAEKDGIPPNLGLSVGDFASNWVHVLNTIRPSIEDSILKNGLTQIDLALFRECQMMMVIGMLDWVCEQRVDFEKILKLADKAHNDFEAGGGTEAEELINKNLH